MLRRVSSWLRAVSAQLTALGSGRARRRKGKKRRPRWVPDFEALEPRYAPAAMTFLPGAIIVDMSQPVQTFGNALKPYGLVYDLVTNYKVPVNWAIDPAKTTFRLDAGDAIPIDFTATIVT